MNIRSDPLVTGEKALDYYLRINPSAREELSEVLNVNRIATLRRSRRKDADNFGAPGIPG